MFARKFLSQLEDHANQLSDGLTEKIARSGKCGELLARVPSKEQKQNMREMYRQMAEWLVSDNKAVNQEYYISLGMRRAQQGVPFSQLLSAVCAARQYFWEYVEQETLLDEPVDFWGGMRLLRSLDSFFDTVLCFAAMGYQKSNKEHAYSPTVVTRTGTE